MCEQNLKDKFWMMSYMPTHTYNTGLLATITCLLCVSVYLVFIEHIFGLDFLAPFRNHQIIYLFVRCDVFIIVDQEVQMDFNLTVGFKPLTGKKHS